MWPSTGSTPASDEAPCLQTSKQNKLRHCCCCLLLLLTYIVVWIEHPSDVFSQIPVQHSLDVVTMIDCNSAMGCMCVHVHGACVYMCMCVTCAWCMCAHVHVCYMCIVHVCACAWCMVHVSTNTVSLLGEGTRILFTHSRRGQSCLGTLRTRVAWC